MLNEPSSCSKKLMRGIDMQDNVSTLAPPPDYDTTSIFEDSKDQEEFDEYIKKMAIRRTQCLRCRHWIQVCLKRITPREPCDNFDSILRK